MNRKETIESIRKALKQRSGKAWSVKGGRGTSYGWITISVMPSREKDGCMTCCDSIELAGLLGLDKVHPQGVKIPSGNDYYQEYIDRANGILPTVYGERYWD